MHIHTTDTEPAMTGNHLVAMKFFMAIARERFRGELIELRYRLEDGHRMRQLFEKPSRAGALARRAIALSEHADVYAGCAPRTRRHGGRDSVKRSFLLWADCDGEDAVAAMRRFDPEPSIIIASGTYPNCHAYWPLERPVGRDELERANRRLAYALGADPACADAARILRVPGTWNSKYPAHTPVEPLRIDTCRHLSLADVVGGLADPPEPSWTSSAEQGADRGNDPLLAIPPDVYVARLLGVEVPRHRKVTCPLHNDRHASLHVYDTPERGWYCYGACRRGGTIYDLAGPLYGFTLRGEDFLRLRAELRRLFGLEAV